MCVGCVHANDGDRESSRSSFYEWQEGICHFFTIFGHEAVRRESFVYVALNKNVAVKPRGRIQSHSASKSNVLHTWDRFATSLGFSYFKK